MTSNQKFFKVFFTILTVLATCYSFSRLLSLMNQPSDMAVGGGILGIVVLCWLVFIVMRKIWKGKSLSSQAKNLSLYILLSSFALTASGCNGCGCATVDPGHVGITINMTGDDRGVDQIPTETGWVWYNPFTKKVYQYPIFVQTAVWTQNKNEGSPNNEEISFNTSDGSVITCDVSLSYVLDPKKVPSFYVKFRSDELDLFTHGFLRNVARDGFNEIASHFRVEEIYGEKKEEFLSKVRDRLNSNLEIYGIKIEQMGTVGPMRIPQVVLDALNQKLAAMQTAMKIENEVKQREAEAKKMVVDAEANAKRVTIEAEANANANRLMTNSISPLLIQWETVKKWNGQVPQVTSGGGLMLQLPKF